MDEYFTIISQNHLPSVFTALHSLQKQGVLCDVILAAEDGEVSAHKVILMASSSYFQDKLSDTFSSPDCPSRIELKGISVDELTHLVQYIYTGKICVSKDTVDVMVELAQILQIKGILQGLKEVQAYESLKQSDRTDVQCSESKTDESLVHNEIETSSEGLFSKFTAQTQDGTESAVTSEQGHETCIETLGRPDDESQLYLEMMDSLSKIVSDKTVSQSHVGSQISDSPMPQALGAQNVVMVMCENQALLNKSNSGISSEHKDLLEIAVETLTVGGESPRKICPVSEYTTKSPTLSTSMSHSINTQNNVVNKNSPCYTSAPSGQPENMAGMKLGLTKKSYRQKLVQQEIKFAKSPYKLYTGTVVVPADNSEEKGSPKQKDEAVAVTEEDIDNCQESGIGQSVNCDLIDSISISPAKMSSVVTGELSNDVVTSECKGKIIITKGHAGKAPRIIVVKPSSSSTAHTPEYKQKLAKTIGKLAASLELNPSVTKEKHNSHEANTSTDNCQATEDGLTTENKQVTNDVEVTTDSQTNDNTQVKDNNTDNSETADNKITGDKTDSCQVTDKHQPIGDSLTSETESFKTCKYGTQRDETTSDNHQVTDDSEPGSSSMTERDATNNKKYVEVETALCPDLEACTSSDSIVRSSASKRKGAKPRRLPLPDEMTDDEGQSSMTTRRSSKLGRPNTSSPVTLTEEKESSILQTPEDGVNCQSSVDVGSKTETNMLTSGLKNSSAEDESGSDHSLHGKSERTVRTRQSTKQKKDPVKLSDNVKEGFGETQTGKRGKRKKKIDAAEHNQDLVLSPPSMKTRRHALSESCVGCQKKFFSTQKLQEHIRTCEYHDDRDNKDVIKKYSRTKTKTTARVQTREDSVDGSPLKEEETSRSDTEDTTLKASSDKPGQLSGDQDSVETKVEVTDDVSTEAVVETKDKRHILNRQSKRTRPGRAGHREHAAERPSLSCSECSAVFKYKVALKNHMLENHAHCKMIQCSLCALQFWKDVDLHKHCFKVHNVPLPKQYKTYTCEQCDFVSWSQSHVDTHKLCHRDDRNYICDLCQRKFKTIGAMKKHMQRHGEKKFPCPYEGCDYKSVSRQSTNTHFRLKHDTETERILCALCNYSSPMKGNVDKHIRTVHGLEVVTKYTLQKREKYGNKEVGAIVTKEGEVFDPVAHDVPRKGRKKKWLRRDEKQVVITKGEQKQALTKSKMKAIELASDTYNKTLMLKRSGAMGTDFLTKDLELASTLPQYPQASPQIRRMQLASQNQLVYQTLSPEEANKYLCVSVDIGTNAESLVDKEMVVAQEEVVVDSTTADSTSFGNKNRNYNNNTNSVLVNAGKGDSVLETADFIQSLFRDGQGGESSQSLGVLTALIAAGQQLDPHVS